MMQTFRSAALLVLCLLGGFKPALAQYLPPAPSLEAWRGAALKNLRSNERTLVQEGLALAAEGKPSEAAAKFEATLRLSPSDSDVSYFLAITQEAAGKPEQAMQALDEALWFAKHSTVPAAEVLAEKSRLLASRGEYAKALPIATQSLALLPKSLSARCAAAASSLAAGNRGDAVRILREAPSPLDSSEQIKFALAKALLHDSNRTLNQNDIEEARVLLAALVLGSPKTLDAKAVSQSYIQSLTASGKLDLAAEEIKRAQKRFTGAPEFAALERQLAIERGARQATEASQSVPTTQPS